MPSLRGSTLALSHLATGTNPTVRQAQGAS